MPKPLIAAALLCLAPPMAPAQSASLDGAEFTLAPIASDLQGPVFLTSAAGDPRLFVVEQPGTIIILDKGAARPSPFADLTESIRSGGEQGLLGLAFHPGYAANGRFFVAYTDPTGDLIIAEMAAPAMAGVAGMRPITRRTRISCWARSCGSTLTRLPPMRSRPPIPLPKAAARPRFLSSALATRGVPVLTGISCISVMWDRANGKRLT